MRDVFWRRAAFVVVAAIFSTEGQSQSADTSEIRRITNTVLALRENNLDSSFVLTQKGMALAKAAEDHVGSIDLLLARGGYYWLKNDYVSAIEDYSEAIRFSREWKYHKGVARALVNLGQVYSKLGDYPTAIEYFLKGITLGDSINMDNSSAYNSLAVAYRRSNHVDLAINALEESLRANRSSHSKVNGLSGGIYTNLGNSYLDKGDLQQAMVYQQKALHIFDSLKQLRGIVTCYNNITEILIGQKNYTEALIWSEKSLALCSANGLTANEASAWENRATIASATKHPDWAIDYLKKAITLAEKNKHRNELIYLYKSMAENYQATGNNNQALVYLNKHIVVKDSILNQESNNKIANMRVGFEINKREIDKRVFQQEREIAVLNRNILISLVTALVVILLILGTNQYSRMKKNKLALQQMEILHHTQQQLMQIELENQKWKQEEMQQEIESKSKELTTHALNLLQKNEMLEEIKESLADINENLQPDVKKDVKKLLSSIHLSHHQDKEWEGFKIHFEKIHVGFFERLQKEYPDLTGNDIKICSLVKLNLGSKETASILGISIESVKTARYRLRKKLKLESSQNLVAFLAGF